jgi:hypothetical protein
VAQRWLLEQSGMIQLVSQLVFKEVTEFTAETNAPISQFVRCHPTEFRIGFGYTKLDKLSDQQIVGTLLGYYGLSTKRHRRRETYSIDSDRLDLLLSILERRQKADPQGQCNQTTPPLWITTEPNEIRQGDLRTSSSFPTAPIVSLTTQSELGLEGCVISA